MQQERFVFFLCAIFAIRSETIPKPRRTEARIALILATRIPANQKSFKIQHEQVLKIA
jgi:hypothetical protein